MIDDLNSKLEPKVLKKIGKDGAKDVRMNPIKRQKIHVRDIMDTLEDDDDLDDAEIPAKSDDQ